MLAKRAGCSRSERVAREASGHERGLLAKRAGCSRSERCEQVYLCELRAGLFTHDNSNSNNNSSSNDNSISNNKNNRKQLFTFVSHLSNRLLSFYNFLRIHLSSHDFIAESQSDRNWLVCVTLKSNCLLSFYTFLFIHLNTLDFSRIVIG